MNKKQFRIASGIIVILCLFLYSNTLENGYALDDEYVIVNNVNVEKGIKGIPNLFLTHYVSFEGETHSYRPVTLTSFAIEYQFFKANPKISHLINLLLYCITCIVLLKLLLRLFKNYHWTLAAIATFIFLIHPVHSEVVNNVKSRDELLCFLFAILSLIHFVKYIDQKRLLFLVFGTLFFVLSMLSKLSSITFIAIIPLTLWFFTDIKLKKLLFFAGGIFIILLSVKYGSKFILASDASTSSRIVMFHENPMFEGYEHFYDRIPMAFFTTGYYVKMLLFPKTLISYYGFNQVQIADWTSKFFWVSAIFIISSTILALVKIKTKQIWIYGLLYFFITISMFSNFVIPLVGIIGERFTYLPSLGFCILIAFLLYKVFKIRTEKDKVVIWKRPILMGVLGIIFIASAGRIMTRNQDWKDVFTLLRHDVQHADKSAKLHSLLANNLFREAKIEPNSQIKTELAREAITHFQKATEIYPNFSTAWNDMGAIYSNFFSDRKSSKYCFQRAVAIDDSYIYAIFNLAFCNELDKEFELAMRRYQRVIELDPENEMAQKQILIVQDSLNRLSKVGQY